MPHIIQIDLGAGRLEKHEFPTDARVDDDARWILIRRADSSDIIGRFPADRVVSIVLEA